MAKTLAERSKEWRARRKLKKAGYVPLKIWALPETAKYMRWGLRNVLSKIKPGTEVKENADKIMQQLELNKDS